MDQLKQWPHAPVHKLSEKGMYMVTSGTYQKVHYFDSYERKKFLHDHLLIFANHYGWKLQAWAVFQITIIL